MSSRMPSIRRPVKTTTKPEDPVDNDGTSHKADHGYCHKIQGRQGSYATTCRSSKPYAIYPHPYYTSIFFDNPRSIHKVWLDRSFPIAFNSSTDYLDSNRAKNTRRLALPYSQCLDYRSLEYRHLRSQSSTTIGFNSRLTTPSTPSTPTSVKTSADPVKPPVRRLVRPGATSSVPNLEPTTSRPAFNTLQQHYSPAKTTLPKPPVPSSRAAPSAGEKAVQSGAVFETTKLQSELLYLSLLHESAEPNFRSYETSARKALQTEFEAAQDEQSGWESREHRFWACRLQKANTQHWYTASRNGQQRRQSQTERTFSQDL
ncbi:hypothetical protein KCU65_g68, partial [Aureobasidium melanogenum]